MPRWEDPAETEQLEAEKRQMSQRSITDCDKCGAPNIDGVKVVVPTERDDVGDQCYAYSDLCNMCAGFAFEYLVEHMTQEERLRFVKQLKIKTALRGPWR